MSISVLIVTVVVNGGRPGQFRLHDLRHFMATEMLAHGVATVTFSQRLGHARASTTINVYGHCVPCADRDAADYSQNSSTAVDHIAREFRLSWAPAAVTRFVSA